MKCFKDNRGRYFYRRVTIRSIKQKLLPARYRYYETFFRIICGEFPTKKNLRLYSSELSRYAAIVTSQHRILPRFSLPRECNNPIFDSITVTIVSVTYWLFGLLRSRIHAKFMGKSRTSVVTNCNFQFRVN